MMTERTVDLGGKRMEEMEGGRDGNREHWRGDGGRRVFVVWVRVEVESRATRADVGALTARTDDKRQKRRRKLG